MIRFAIALTLLLTTPFAAAARMIMPPRAGTIADDNREIAGAPGEHGVSALKRFDHKPYLTGSTIALLPGEKRLIIADTDNGAVVVVDAETRVVHHTIAVGRRPERLVVAPSGLVYVTNRASRTVSVVDPKRGIELRSVTAGVEPVGIALTADAKTLLVTSSATSELLGFHAQSLSLRFRIALDQPWPVAVAAHPDGKRAFVSHMQGNTVNVIDVERQKAVSTLTLPEQDTGLPGRLTGRFMTKRTANLAQALTVSPGGTRLFVSHTMVNTGAARGIGVGSGGYGMGAESPIVATVSTFDLESGKLIRPKVNFGKARRAFGLIRTDDVNMQMMQQPIAVVHDPSNARLLMVAMGSDKVMALNARASDPITRPFGAWKVGQAPKGVAVSRDGSKAFAHNAHSYDVSVIQLSKGVAPNAQKWVSTEAARFQISRNPLPATAAAGRRMFTFALDTRISGNNRFACASCHPGGRQDGLVWHIGAGPRQTPILADRLTGTAPFNWLGTEAKLHANVVQTIKRLGGSAIKDDELNNLITYMTSYMDSPDNPSRDTRMSAQVALGKQLFHDDEVGCSGCHDSGSRYTDGTRHEVGTTTTIERQLWERFGKHQNKPGGPPGSAMPQQRKPREIVMQDQIISGPFANPAMREPIQEAPVAYDTPSLKYLWASAPYYHDGSQGDLKALLTTGNKGDKMGKTSHLNGEQIDALVAYLRTL